jgi:hypothetical protein
MFYGSSWLLAYGLRWTGAESYHFDSLLGKGSGAVVGRAERRVTGTAGCRRQDVILSRLCERQYRRRAANRESAIQGVVCGTFVEEFSGDKR